MQSGEKLHGLVIYMSIYDLGGKVLVLVVSLAVVCPLPWSSVPRLVKPAPTSEAVCAVGVDSYREEFHINNVVKKSLKKGLCHNYKTLLSGCRLTTGNQQRREESAQFMLGIITGIFLLEVLFHFFIEALPAEIIRKVGIGDPTDSV